MRLHATCPIYLQRAMLLAAVAFLASCSLLGDAGAEDELRVNRRRWQQAGATDYEFAYSQFCFCGITRYYPQPSLVVVRGDTVNAVLDVATREPVIYAVTGEPIPPDHYVLFPTMDGLFEVIEQAIEYGVHKLEVEYDRALGFPASIQIDHIADVNVADDGVSYKVEGFRILSE